MSTVNPKLIKNSLIAQEKGPATKERLSSIVQGFDDFDSEMKSGTRVSISILFYFQCIILKFVDSKRKGRV